MLSQKESLTILIIDDEHLILDIVSEMLNFLNHRAIVTSSAHDGIELFKQKRNEIDAIIVDLIMPDMNGKECYEELRKIDPHIPIVLSTGISDAGSKEGLKNLDVLGFLEKPYTLPQLESILNKIKTADS